MNSKTDMPNDVRAEARNLEVCPRARRRARAEALILIEHRNFKVCQRALMSAAVWVQGCSFM